MEGCLNTVCTCKRLSQRGEMQVVGGRELPAVEGFGNRAKLLMAVQ